MSGLALFHFLRPWWLLAIPAIALVWWLVRRRETKKSRRLPWSGGWFAGVKLKR